MNGGEEMPGTEAKSRPRTTSPALLIWVMSRACGRGSGCGRSRWQRLSQWQRGPCCFCSCYCSLISPSHFCIFSAASSFPQTNFPSCLIFRPVSLGFSASRSLRVSVFILYPAHLVTSQAGKRTFESVRDVWESGRTRLSARGSLLWVSWHN